MQKIKIPKKQPKKTFTYRNDIEIQRKFVNKCEKKGMTHSYVLQQLTEKFVNDEIIIE